VTDNSKAERDKRNLAALREYFETHNRWWGAELDNLLRKSRLGGGQTVSKQEPLDPAPLRQKLDALGDELRQILILEEMGGPLVRIQSDGGEARADVLAAQYMEEFVDDFRARLRNAITSLEKRVPSEKHALPRLVTEAHLTELTKRLSILESRSGQEPWTRAHKFAAVSIAIAGIGLGIVILRLVQSEGLSDTKIQLLDRMRKLEDRFDRLQKKAP